MQACTGLAYSTFLILPKHLTVNLKASGAQIGLVMAAFGLANVLAAPLVQPVQRRLERRSILVAANVVMALAGLGFLAVQSAGALAAALRAVQGAAWALIFPAGSHLAARMAPPDRLGQAIALHSSANLITNALGLAIVEPLLEHLGPAPVFLFAVATAAAGAVLARGLPGDGAPGPSGAAGRGDALEPLPVFPLVASGVLGLACGAVFTFYQPLAIERGARRVADFLVAYTAVAIAIRVGGGRVMDRVGYRRLAGWSALAYGGVVALMPLLAPGNLVVLGSFFGAVHGLFYPCLVTVTLQASPLRRRDAALAWLNGAFHAGSVGVAPLGLVASHFGYAAAFLPVGALISAIAAGFARRRSG